MDVPAPLKTGNGYLDFRPERPEQLLPQTILFDLGDDALGHAAPKSGDAAVLVGDPILDVLPALGGGVPGDVVSQDLLPGAAIVGMSLRLAASEPRGAGTFLPVVLLAGHLPLYTDGVVLGRGGVRKLGG